MSILISLGALMYLAYRGYSVLVLAPLLALLAVLLGGDTRLLAMYTQVFMTGLGGFLIKYFPLFLLGAIFGRLMSDSGAADTIARAIVLRIGAHRAVMALVLSCAILTYGGVSVFVVAFAAYPVGAALFREAGIPKRLIPGALVLGSATFTMTALPGTPAIQNAIPMPYFGTDAFAAPGLGVLVGIIMFAGGMWWLTRRARLARAAGEGYGHHHIELATPHTGNTAGDQAPNAQRVDGPSFLTAILPVALVIGLNLMFTRWIIPAMDSSYLAEPKFGAVTLNDVRGVWSLIAAIFAAIVVAIVLHWSRWRDLRQSVNEGTMGSLLPIFNTASEVGYGSVIASLAAFAVIREAVVGFSPANPLVSEAIAVNIMAGITGSASGGLSIALNMLGNTYLELGNTAGISPQLLHRVASVASGGLDSLPHNGAIITLLSICHLTHRESYLD
ncbi:MAG: GntP family permease, partial [Gemmatimonas sp.]